MTTTDRPSSTSRELVLGIPRAAIPGGLDWRGLRAVAMAPMGALAATLGEYRVRADAEDDPSFQQLIPYVVVRDGSRVFLTHRLHTGGDTRLHDRYSIGIGGHVGPDDGGLDGGLRREWAEELVADWEPEFDPLGVLNMDDDPVGAVHLGFVYTVDADGRPVSVRETHKLEGSFAEIAEIDALGDRLESWSRLVLDHLLGR